MANDHNHFKIRDLPKETECTLSFLTPDNRGGGIHFFTLYDGSPLRKLLELQEIYEESFEAGRKARAEAEEKNGL